VLCVLLDPAGRSEGIGEAQQRRIRELFAVGGYSFNAPRESYEASRRIELRVEFLALAESESAAPAPSNAVDVGTCALGR
jgi:hypothetical protein